MPYRRADFTLPARSPVALMPAASYDADLSDAISRGLDLLDLSVRGKRVFLKPNMVEYSGTRRSTPTRSVVAAAATAFLPRGRARGDRRRRPGPSARHRVSGRGTGLDEVLRDLQACGSSISITTSERGAAQMPVHGTATRCGCRRSCCTPTSSSRCRS